MIENSNRKLSSNKLFKTILLSLKDNEKLQSTLKDLSYIKDTMTKNYINPVLTSSAQKQFYKQLQYITKLDDLLQKYEKMRKNNIKKDAKLQSDEISETVILKGGVSYNRYVWRTEPNACEECQALDGKIFEFIDDIPEIPHPNCKCHVDVLEEDDEDDELCDCGYLFDTIDEMIGEGEDLSAEIESDIADIENMKSNSFSNKSEMLQGMWNDYVSLEQPYNTLMQTLSTFLVNYQQMKDADTRGADKYFHAKANCEAAQLGIVGSVVAQALSDLRELTDNFRNIHEKKMSLEESMRDIEEDQKANQEGRELGRLHPSTLPYILLQHRIPKGFPDRYKH